MSVSECFSIGSIVGVITCFNENIEGQVMGFDMATKLLILKCNSEKSPKLNDVYIINISLCKEVNVKKDVNVTAEPPKSVNLQRLSNRVRNQVEMKKSLVSALKANVCEEAQNLFMSLAKTLSTDKVCWNGADIIVFNEVIIKPPYKPENVETHTNNVQQLSYIKKLIDLNSKKLQQQQGSPSASGTGTSTPSSTIAN